MALHGEGVGDGVGRDVGVGDVCWVRAGTSETDIRARERQVGRAGEYCHTPNFYFGL